jgi:diguanylate cyclase
MSGITDDQTNDAEIWKEKYRDAVRELDEKEHAWQDKEVHLHKSLLRLSFSYAGADSKLDAQLKRLQSDLKKNPDAQARNILIDDIVNRITALADDKPGEGEKSNVDSAAIVALIARLKLPQSHAAELNLLAAKFRENDRSGLENHTRRLVALLNQAFEAAQSSAGGDTFIKFLSKFSSPGSLGDRIAILQKRSAVIKTDIERLSLIDDTVALIRDELGRNIQPSNATNEARSIVRELIDWMTLPSQVKDELKGIQSKLESASSEQDLSSILRDLGYTVGRFHGSLMSELTDVEFYLKNIAIRLKELQLGIDETFGDQQTSLEEQENLSTGVTKEIVEITSILASSDDLATVRQFIDEGFVGIRDRMQGHLERNRERVAKGEKRLLDLTKKLQTIGDESTRLRAQVKLERDRSQSDALTGIANRSAYDERIGNEVGRRNRHNRSLSLAVIDIDKFKDVNDKLGHKAGDKVLKKVAEISVSRIRSNDFLARYGGEEFVLILPETSSDQAFRVAEKLREEIAGKGFYYDGRRVPITVSIGIAEFTGEDSADDVFKRADRAMYAAKQGGRNCCVKDLELPRF